MLQRQHFDGVDGLVGAVVGSGVGARVGDGVGAGVGRGVGELMVFLHISLQVGIPTKTSPGIPCWHPEGATAKTVFPSVGQKEQEPEAEYDVWLLLQRQHFDGVDGFAGDGVVNLRRLSHLVRQLEMPAKISKLSPLRHPEGAGVTLTAFRCAAQNEHVPEAEYEAKPSVHRQHFDGDSCWLERCLRMAIPTAQKRKKQMKRTAAMEREAAIANVWQGKSCSWS